MKQHEYLEIINIIESCLTAERNWCENYCKANPGDRKRRERDRDLAMQGLNHALFEINKRVMTNRIHIES